MDKYSFLVEKNCAVKIIGIEKMFSRRNQVYLLNTVAGGNRPVKYLAKVGIESRAAKESARLRELKALGINVPTVVWSNQQIIVMEYIDGILLADLMENKELMMQKQWLKHLVVWLAGLHSIQNVEQKVFCVPDLNLRNFIYTGRGIVGIDYEKTVWDRPERDLGGILAFILNSNPMFTPEKYEVIYQLLLMYREIREINLDMVEEYFFIEMEKAAKRRKKQREYLLTKISELKENGFLNSTNLRDFA